MASCLVGGMMAGGPVGRMAIGSWMDEPDAISRWFVKRGVPSLLDGSDVGRDVTRRMAPALVVLYLIALVPFATRGPWSLLTDGAFAVLSVVATWVVSNLSRGRRPFTPRVTLGAVEFGLFVLVPPLIGVVVGRLAGAGAGAGAGDEGTAWIDVAVTVIISVLIQLVLLAVVWVLVYFGVLALLTWLTREVIGSLGDVGVTVARTVPLLLGVVTFFFFTAEVWQAIGRVGTVGYVGVVALFVGTGGLFLFSRRQFDLASLARFETRADLEQSLRTGAVPGLDAGGVELPADCPLSPPQERNLRLVAALSRLVVAALVGSWVFAFFFCLGLLAVSGETVKAWTQADPELLAQGAFLGQTVTLTWEHVKVAGFLAVFTGFYFAVVSATDSRLREGLRDTADDAVRQACAARLALLHARPPAAFPSSHKRASTRADAPTPSNPRSRVTQGQSVAQPGSSRAPRR